MREKKIYQTNEVPTTKKERRILEHTIGLDYNDHPHRNYYACMEDPLMDGLVAKGLMLKRVDAFNPNSFIYGCTPLGKEEVYDLDRKRKVNVNIFPGIEVYCEEHCEKECGEVYKLNGENCQGCCIASIRSIAFDVKKAAGIG